MMHYIIEISERLQFIIPLTCLIVQIIAHPDSSRTVKSRLLLQLEHEKSADSDPVIIPQIILYNFRGVT